MYLLSVINIQLFQCTVVMLLWSPQLQKWVMTHNLGQIINWQCLIKLSFFTDGHAGWSPPEGNGDLVGFACFEWVQASSFWELWCTYCMCLPKGPFGWHDAVWTLSRGVPLWLRYNDRRGRVRPSLALPVLPAVEETPSGQGAAPVSFTAEDSGSTAGGGRPALPHREDGAMAAQSSAGLHRGSAGESVKDGALKQMWHLLDGVVDPTDHCQTYWTSLFLVSGASWTQSIFTSDSGNKWFPLSYRAPVSSSPGSVLAL